MPFRHQACALFVFVCAQNLSSRLIYLMMLQQTATTEYEDTDRLIGTNILYQQEKSITKTERVQ